MRFAYNTSIITTESNYRGTPRGYVEDRFLRGFLGEYNYGQLILEIQNDRIVFLGPTGKFPQLTFAVLQEESLQTLTLQNEGMRAAARIWSRLAPHPCFPVDTADPCVICKAFSMSSNPESTLKEQLREAEISEKVWRRRAIEGDKLALQLAQMLIDCGKAEEAKTILGKLAEEL